MVYFILNKELNHVKIGYSNDIHRRVKQLQTSSSTELELHFFLNGDYRIEKLFHKYFKKYHVRNEWYNFENNIEQFIYYIQHIQISLEDCNKKNNKNFKIEDFGISVFVTFFDLMDLEGYQILNILKVYRQIQNIYNLEFEEDKLSSIDYCKNCDEELDDLKYYMIGEIFFNQVDYDKILGLCKKN